MELVTMRKIYEFFFERPSANFPVAFFIVVLFLGVSLVMGWSSYKFIFMNFEDQEIVYLGAGDFYVERIRGGNIIQVDVSGKQYGIIYSCLNMAKKGYADIYVFRDAALGSNMYMELAYLKSNDDSICESKRLNANGFSRVVSDKRAEFFLIVFCAFCYFSIVLVSWRGK